MNHANHYCPRCGNTGRVQNSGEVEQCPDCAPPPKLWVSVLVAVAALSLIGGWLWLICTQAK